MFSWFGYHRENLAPLEIESGKPGKTVIGTARGLTKGERGRLDLARYVDHALDCTILELLRQTDVIG